jgi:hypothetical protein
MIVCWSRWVRQPFCDESGVGFAALLAENSTPLWSHHSVPRRDGTWLPEWSGNLGGVERCAVRSHLKLEGASLAVNPLCLLIRKSGEWRLN